MKLSYVEEEITYILKRHEYKPITSGLLHLIRQECDHFLYKNLVSDKVETVVSSIDSVVNIQFYSAENHEQIRIEVVDRLINEQRKKSPGERYGLYGSDLPIK